MLRKAKKINTQGYILIYKPEHHFADYQGYVREHRIVFEEIYKCSLLPWGDVHHKNGNKLDNRKKNLEGMMHYKHLQLHIDESRIKNGMLKRKCSKCGSNVTRMRQHEKGQRLGYEWYKNPFNKSEWWCSVCYGRYNAARYHRRKKKLLGN